MSVAPEMVKVFLGQSLHYVSAPGEQSEILYIPVPHVAQVLHPAAPASLVSPLPQLVQTSAAPVEYFPAAHSSSDVMSPLVESAFGLWPAEAVLQLLAPTVSEYFPSPLQVVHSLTAPPNDALPATQPSH